MIPVVFDNCRGWLHPRTDAGDFKGSRQLQGKSATSREVGNSRLPGADFPAPTSRRRLRVGSSRRGVIVCGAHGFEDLCSRSSMRLLAEDLSSRGLPTLRFDWRGTADSEGDGEAPHRVATWLGNIGEAARILVDMTGVEEIALVGLRLGALLALEAARDIAPVRLVLLAPPASGRALKRELEVMSRIFQGKPGAGDDAGFDGVSAAGFRISRATLDDLALVGSRRLSGAQDCETLVLSQDPEGSPLAEKLREKGAKIVVEPFEGYAEMMCDPTAALPPMKAIGRIADFVSAGVSPDVASAARRSIRCVAGSDGDGLLHRSAPRNDGLDPAILATDVWREEAAQFGPDDRLVGIFCQRAAGERRSKAVVFLNSGGVYHIGWARMFVDMARHLAANDVASLRMDLSGVGDSLSPQGPDRAPLFDRGLTRDVEAAIDWLYARGIRDVSLFGACSGAYQAFHAAIKDRRVTRIALVNQACFIYGPTYAMQMAAWRRTKAADVGMKLASAGADAQGEPKGARALLFSLAKKVVKAGLVHATDAAYAIRRRVPGLNLVERWFGELSARGAEVLLVYSENDPGLSELERHLGARSRAEAPLPGVRTAVIANADHELTPQSARLALSAALDGFVGGRDRKAA